MVYSQEEKLKMDAVLLAFQSYVDGREDYEILYSKKAGYLRVLIGESCDAIYFPITGFADMITMFADDFLQDENPGGYYEKRDFDHARSLLAPRLDTLANLRQEASRIMEATFSSRERPACRSLR